MTAMYVLDLDCYRWYDEILPGTAPKAPTKGLAPLVLPDPLDGD